MLSSCAKNILVNMRLSFHLVLLCRLQSSPPIICDTFSLPSDELLLKICAEFPDTVETIVALATVCRRLNENTSYEKIVQNCLRQKFKQNNRSLDDAFQILRHLSQLERFANLGLSKRLVSWPALDA